MLSYFPRPYTDELLYSVIARYGIHRGIYHSKELVHEVFAGKNAAAVVDFPGHLNALVSQMGKVSSYTPWDWIQYHTLYPAYLAFQPPDKRDLILQSAYSDQSSDIHTRIGSAASKIKNARYLKICKQCYLEQKKTLGEVYWQRTFQMPGVFFCPVHEKTLFITDVLQHPVSKYTFTPAECLNVIGRLDYSEIQVSKKRLLQLARSIYEILNIPNQACITYEQISNYYFNLASRFNLASGKRVDHARVEDKFKTYWPIDCISQIDSSLAPLSNWLTPIFRKHRKTVHPLCHLLVWQAFGANHPIEIINNIHRISIRIDNISDGNENHRPNGCVENKRWKWLDFCDRNPQKGIKWLRMEGGAAAIYAWLYRNDRVWLRSHCPPRVKGQHESHRVDWNARDNRILNELIEVKKTAKIDALHSRMTKAWYIKHTKLKSTIEKNIDKLPLCKDYIDNNSETIEQFQRRRICSVIGDLKNNNNYISFWAIIRKAGIRKKYITNDLIEFIKGIDGCVGE